MLRKNSPSIWCLYFFEMVVEVALAINAAWQTLTPESFENATLSSAAKAVLLQMPAGICNFR